MTVDLRPRSFAENLALLFRLTARHFVPLLIVRLVFALPPFVILLANSRASAGGRGRWSAEVDLTITWLVTPLLGLLSASAATLIVAESFTGRRTGVAAALVAVLRRIVALVGLGVVILLCTGVAAIVGFVPIGLPAQGAGSVVLVVIAGVLAGSLALVVWSRLYVAQCAIVLEGRGVFASTARSSALTRGRRVMAAATFLVTWLLGVVAQTLFAQFVVVLLVNGSFEPDLVLFLAMFGLHWLVGVVASLPAVVAPVVLYFSFRASADGFDVEQLATLVDEIDRRAATAHSP